MKAQRSAPVVQQVVTLKSTGVTGLTIGLMILTGSAEVPSERLEQVWNMFSAEGPVNGGGKLHPITITTIWNLGSPGLYLVVNNFHVVGKLMSQAWFTQSNSCHRLPEILCKVVPVLHLGICLRKFDIIG